MRPVTLVLVRHGESEWNLAGRWQGHGGSGLTQLGHRQAAAAARAVAARHPDAMLVARSDLLRVAQTSEPLEELLGVPVVVDRRLRELDVGSWSGLTHDEIRVSDRERFDAWQRGDDVAMGGGERRGDLVRRVDEALRDLIVRVERGGGGTAVVVAHGGTIRAAAAGLLERDAWQWDDFGGVANASVTELGWVQGRARILRWASTDHLEGDLDDRTHADVSAPR